MKTASFFSVFLLLISIAVTGARADTAAPEEPEPLSGSSGLEPSGPGFSLHDAVTIALEHNYDIKLAKERLEKQYHVVVEARAGMLPKLGIAGQLDRTDERRLDTLGEAPFGSEDNWTIEIRVTQPIFAGGRDFAALRQGKILEEAAKEELSASVNDVLYKVQEAYYGVLLAKSQVDVQRQNLSLYEEQLRTEKNRLEAGMVSDYDVLRAEVNLANSKTPFIRARNQYKISWEDLHRVLGIDDLEEKGGAPPPKKLSETLEFKPYVMSLAEAIKTAEEKRPELRRAKLLVNAQEEGVKLERADYFPSLGVFGAYGADKSRFSDDFNDENHGWVVGTQLSWNLFDGLRTMARVDEAKSDLEQAHIAYAQLRQSIRVDVRRVHSSFIEAGELVKASSKVVESGEEALRLARTRYDSGSATYLDLLDSQVALTQARTNQIQALHDYNLAWAALRQAIGSIQE